MKKDPTDIDVEINISAVFLALCLFVSPFICLILWVGGGSVYWLSAAIILESLFVYLTLKGLYMLKKNKEEPKEDVP